MPPTLSELGLLTNAAMIDYIAINLAMAESGPIGRAAVAMACLTMGAHFLLILKTDEL